MTKILSTLILAALILVGCESVSSESKDTADSRSQQLQLFEDGNYAMFMHFGLYSKLEGVWKGKTYRGNAEWIMNGNQAGIPYEEYMAEADTFNPCEFDADAIAQMAKDAGMKYIVITSKHHEGYAMFGSDACDFNIRDCSAVKRDLIGELAAACHEKGIGIGFYYSQFQDWTAPGGGGGGPETDASGRKVTFDEYFRTKCVPQVNEITTKYGDIELIWFDTPGDMDIKYSKELVDLVHKNQPGCLVSSRVGNGMGDYETYGDMEIPVANIDGLWEGIDVMQVGWGFSVEDAEWKSPEYVLRNLLSTVARGGTFMMNVGPDHLGRIPEPAKESLLKAGEWIKRYPMAVYAAEPSPWGHALQWGDAVAHGDKLYLLVNDWPSDGTLEVPGIRNGIESVRICGGKRLKFHKDGCITTIHVPGLAPDSPYSVIEICLKGQPDIDRTFVALDGYSTEIQTAFAEAKGCLNGKIGWMPRFGEWNTKWGTSNMETGSELTWTIEIPHEGYYDFDVEMRGNGRVDFTVGTDEGRTITNYQPLYNKFSWSRAGWIQFEKPGKHTVTVTFPGDIPEDLNIGGLRVTPITGCVHFREHGQGHS